MEWLEFMPMRDDLQDAFKGFSNKRADVIFEKYSHVSKTEMRACVDELIANSSYTPKESDFFNYFDSRKEHETQISQEEIEDIKKFNAEEKRFQTLLKQFVDSSGAQNIDLYYKAWLKNVFNLSESDLLMQNLDSKLLLKPAIFDLADANGVPKRAIEKGKQKQIKLDLERNKHKTNYKMNGKYFTVGGNQ